METNTMKCKKCGSPMKKIDEHTMKCEKCGNVETSEKKESPTRSPE